MAVNLLNNNFFWIGLESELQCKFVESLHVLSILANKNSAHQQVVVYFLIKKWKQQLVMLTIRQWSLPNPPQWDAYS